MKKYLINLVSLVLLSVSTNAQTIRSPGTTVINNGTVIYTNNATFNTDQFTLTSVTNVNIKDSSLVTNLLNNNSISSAYDTIADLVNDTSLPSVFSSGKISAMVSGRLTKNDGAGGLFFYNASSSTATNRGTVFKPASSAGRWIRDYSGTLNPLWFGCKGDGIVDDTIPLQACINATPIGGKILLNNANYLLSTNLTMVNTNVEMRGPGTLSAASNFSMILVTNGCTFYGFTILAPASGAFDPPHVFDGNSTNLSNIMIDGCSIRRGSIFIQDDNVLDNIPKNQNITVQNCTFTGDYDGWAHSDNCNPIDIRSCVGVTISKNRFFCSNSERIIAEGGSSFNVSITDNIIVSTSNPTSGTGTAKQAVQVGFVNGRKSVVTGNVMTLSGSWSTAIEAKSGYSVLPVPTASAIEDVVIANNVIDFSTSWNPGANVIDFYGPWGLTNLTTNLCGIAVANNVIRGNPTNSLDALVQIAGFTSATITGNSVDRVNGIDSAKGIEIANCANITLTGNTIRNAVLSLSGGLRAPDATPYTNSPLLITIVGNTIQNYTGLAGVFFNVITNASSIIVSGNAIQSSSASASPGAIWLLGVTVTNFSAIANVGASDTGYYFKSGGTSIGRESVFWNSWQVNGPAVDRREAVWGADGGIVPGIITDSGTFIGINNTTPTNVFSAIDPFGLVSQAYEFRSSGSSGILDFTANNFVTNRYSIARIYGTLTDGTVAFQRGDIHFAPISSGVVQTNAMVIVDTGLVAFTNTIRLSGLSANQLVATDGSTNLASSGVSAATILYASTNSLTNGTSLGTGWPIFSTKSGQQLLFNSVTNDATLQSTISANRIIYSMPSIAANIGTFTNATVTIDSQGRVTAAAANGISGSVTNDVTLSLGMASTVATVSKTNYYRAKEAITIRGVKAYLFKPSTSGSVTMDIKKNGTTILSSPVSLTAGQTNVSATVSVTTAAAGDALAAEITAAGTGAYGPQIQILYTAP